MQKLSWKLKMKQKAEKFTFFVPNRSWGAFSLMRVKFLFFADALSSKHGKFSLLLAHK
jgi:hypothetical protein